MITCWSQLRSDAVFTRSAISASRVLSSSNFAWLTARKPIPSACERRAWGEAPRTTFPPGCTVFSGDGGRGLYPPSTELGPAENQYEDRGAIVARAVAK